MSIQPDDPIQAGEVVFSPGDMIGPPSQQEAARQDAAAKRSRMTASLKRIAVRLGGALIGLVIVLAVGVTIASHRFAFSRNAALHRNDAAEVSPEDIAALRRDTQALSSRLDAADTRIASLEKLTQQAAPAGNPQLGDLNARLTAVDSQLSALQSQMARTADKESEAVLAARIGKLETDNSGTKLHQAAGVLALATLARAAQEGLPFAAQLAALQATVKDDPVIAALRPIAADGAPTFAILQARFPDAARRTLDAERRDAAQGHVLARLWASLRSLVSIRRVGDAQGETSSDRLARAQDDLDRNDLAGAVMETRALTGVAADAIAPWRDSAQARLTLDRTVAALSARAVQELAGQAAPDSLRRDNAPEIPDHARAASPPEPPPAQADTQTGTQTGTQTDTRAGTQPPAVTPVPAPAPAQPPPAQTTPAQTPSAQPPRAATPPATTPPAPRALPRVPEPSSEIPEGARSSAPLPPPP